MNLEKEFIPYNEALELKELGFNESCLGYWSNWGTQEPFLLTCELGTEKESCSIRRKNFLCTAPTFSQAFRWFREKYELFGEVIMYIPQEGDLDGCFTYVFSISSVENYTKKAVVNRKYYTSYEEAELACLKKLIEIVKSQK